VVSQKVRKAKDKREFFYRACFKYYIIKEVLMMEIKLENKNVKVKRLGDKLLELAPSSIWKGTYHCIEALPGIQK